MTEQLENENEQLRATNARGREHVADLEKRLREEKQSAAVALSAHAYVCSLLAAKARCIADLEAANNGLRLLNERLEARIAQLDGCVTDSDLRSEFEDALHKIAVQDRETEQLHALYDEARLQAQEYQKALLVQGEQIDAAKDEAAALTYKLAEANDGSAVTVERDRLHEQLAAKARCIVELERQRAAQKEDWARVANENRDLRSENRTLAKEVDNHDTRLAQLAKRIRDYHESLRELIDEVQDLERANGALTDQVAELRESQAMSQFDKIKDAPDF